MASISTSSSISDSDDSTIDSDQDTGVALDQDTILKQLEEEDNRAVETTTMEFIRSDFEQIRDKPKCPWWLWLLLGIIALLILALAIGLGLGLKTTNLGVSVFECGVENEEGIVYRVYVESFTKTSNFDGVKNKLDYIKNLGTKYIVLSQGFANELTQSVDFLEINEAKSGTWEQFQDLTQAAGEKGMRVLIELNIISTTFDSEIFDRSMFVADRNKTTYFPYFPCSPQMHSNSSDTFLCINSFDRPVLNASNENVKSKYKDILEKWMEHGACGFFLHDMDLVYTDPKGKEVGPNKKLLNDVKEVVDKTEDAIIIADIGGQEIYATESIEELYSLGAQMVLGYKMTSLSHWFSGNVNFTWMETFFREDNNLIKNKKEIPFFITGGQTLYATSENEKKSYPSMFLLAFTLPGTPIITAGEEYGRIGSIGSQFDWERAKNNEMTDLIQKLAKIRTTKSLTKFDESYLENNETTRTLSIYRSSASGLKYHTMINLDSQRQNVTLKCSEGVLQDFVLVSNRTLTNTRDKCTNDTVFNLEPLESIFVYEK